MVYYGYKNRVEKCALSAVWTGSCHADEVRVLLSAVHFSHPAAEYKGIVSFFSEYGKKEVIFIMQQNKTRLDNIKMLCLAGVMAALYVCFDILATVTVSAPTGGTMKLSMSGLPVIIVSIFCGPWWGAATGFVGAFIGQMLTYGFTATTLLWILPAVARGLVVGYLFRVFKKSIKPGILTLQISISAVVVTLLNTGAMLIEQKLYGYYSSYVAIFVAIPSRVIAGVVTAIVFSLMLPTIIGSLNKYLKIK